ncbi:MAG: caspase family protein [Hyphomonas sp.]|nr:caspase family protein [Hyphomonas sp.]
MAYTAFRAIAALACVALACLLAPASRAEAPGGEDAAVDFRYVPPTEDWVYLRKELIVIGATPKLDEINFGKWIDTYQQNMTARIAADYSSVSIVGHSWRHAEAYQRLQDYPDFETLAPGTYTKAADGRILLDGRPAEPPKAYEIVSEVGTTWPWMSLAAYLDGQSWAVGETRDLSEEMKAALWFGASGDVSLTFMEQGPRWGRDVLTFQFRSGSGLEDPGEKLITAHLDAGTLRPILILSTARMRGFRTTKSGKQRRTVQHTRVERVYRFPDLPLLPMAVNLVDDSFAYSIDSLRKPVDLAITESGETLLIQEARKDASGAIEQRIGSWNISAGKPVDTLPVRSGFKFANPSLAPNIRMFDPSWTHVIGSARQTLALLIESAGNRYSADDITAVSALGQFELVGFQSGRLKLRDGGFDATYESLQPSESAIVGIAAIEDTGSLIALDAGGTLRQFRIVNDPDSFCTPAADRFRMHCDGLSFRIEPEAEYAVIGFPQCMAETGRSLTIAPDGHHAAWTRYTQQGTECRPDGSSYSIRLADGAAALRLDGAGAAFADAGTIVTSAGLQTVEGGLIRPFIGDDYDLDLAGSGTQKIVVSAPHKTAFLLAELGSYWQSVILQVDLASGLLRPMVTPPDAEASLAAGLFGSDVFGITNKGRLVVENVSTGTVQVSPFLSRQVKEANAWSAWDAHVLSDDGQGAMLKLGSQQAVFGVAGNNLGAEGTASPPFGVFIGQNLDSIGQFSDGTLTAYTAGGLLVTNGALKDNSTFLPQPARMDVGNIQTVAISGSGDTLRIVTARLPAGAGGIPGIFPTVEIYRIDEGELILDRSIAIEIPVSQLLLAASPRHNHIVLGRLVAGAEDPHWEPFTQLYRVIDSLSGETVSEIPTLLPQDTNARAIAYAPDGINLLELLSGGQFRVYDTDLQLELGTLGNDAGQIHKLRTLSNGVLASESRNGNLQLWTLDFIDTGSYYSDLDRRGFSVIFPSANQSLIATLLPPTAQNGEPPAGAFIFTPEGYYSGDKTRLAELSFADINGTIEFSQFDLWLNRPDVTLARLGMLSEADLATYRTAVEKRQSRLAAGESDGFAYWTRSAPTIQLARAGTDSLISDGDFADIRIDVKSETPTEEIVIRVNGTPVARRKDTGTDFNETIRIPIASGNNRVTAEARSVEGISGRAATLDIFRPAPERRSRLFVFAAGVSDYANDALDLHYAAKDATDLARFLQLVEGETQVRIMTNGDVGANIMDQARDFFASATPDDRLVLFLSGHGFLTGDGGYVFAPHEFDPDRPARTGLPISVIESAFRDTPSLNRAILIDSCHAGDFDAPAEGFELVSAPEEITVRGTRGLSRVRVARPDDSVASAFRTMKSAFSDLNTESGAHVIAASGGLEYSVEGTEWENGVFTYALLKGLRGHAADFDGDGQVEIREISRYVQQEVPRLTNFGQVPSNRSDNIFNNFVLDGAD